LIEILFLAVIASLSGVNHWKHMSTFGKINLDWYRKYFPYKNGIPSNVTLGRVFASIDIVQFDMLFTKWVLGLKLKNTKTPIAIDGKRLRGSYDKVMEKPALHIVSAFAVQAGISIAQKSCDSKSNEITTIPDILDRIEKKSIITIDAMGCQKDIAEKIIENESDYILAVKQNQDELHRQTIKMFSIKTPACVDTTIDVGHGRIETRTCTIVNDLTFMDNKNEWAGLKSLVKIETERIEKISEKSELNTRYYISSLNHTAKQFNKHIRNHWAIENKLHWVLDEVFGEDKSRRRKSAESYNIIAKIALALLNKTKGDMQSISEMRMKAGWSAKYRENLLNFK
jgi:predicted transposase YbfD/YdcC